MKLRLLLFAICFIISIGLINGCDVTNQNTSTKQVNVNMMVISNTANKTPTTQAVDSVTLDNIKLLVKKLELKSEGEFEHEQETDDEHTAENGEGEEFELTNQVFDLPLDGSSVSISTDQIPTGTYHRVELKIGPAEKGSNIQDSALVEGDADSLRYSLVIKGTAGGDGFTYKTHKKFEMEISLNPPVEVTDSTQSAAIDLTVDPSNWFKDPDTGNYLDPNDPENHDVIESNIAHSFKAEYHEDSEHEGDHNGHSGDEGDEDHEDE